ncbi:MAG TPA: hypothetical protein VKX25_17470 [Bryobacteraceae bacterium]|nr:hypothetical protein [Bryobacteraceae bacterium]
MNSIRHAARATLPILATLWAGTIIGVSFVATPAKFQAASLSLRAGVEVGRYTFQWFSALELVFSSVVVVAAILARTKARIAIMLAVAVIELLLQRYWLLPELDRRVSEILAGAPVVFSPLHWMYAALDASKAALLITASAMEYRSPRN